MSKKNKTSITMSVICKALCSFSINATLYGVTKATYKSTLYN